MTQKQKTEKDSGTKTGETKPKGYGLVFEMVEGIDYRMNHGKRELCVNNLDTMMKFMFNEPHDGGIFTWVKERALAGLAEFSREDAVQVLVDAFGGDALRAICAAEGSDGVLRALGELYGADVERRKRENAESYKRALGEEPAIH